MTTAAGTLPAQRVRPFKDTYAMLPVGVVAMTIINIILLFVGASVRLPQGPTYPLTATLTASQCGSSIVNVPVVIENQGGREIARTRTSNARADGDECFVTFAAKIPKVERYRMTVGDIEVREAHTFEALKLKDFNLDLNLETEG